MFTRELFSSILLIYFPRKDVFPDIPQGRIYEERMTLSRDVMIIVHANKRRDVLGCTFPTTKRYRQAQEMSRSEGMFDPDTSQLKSVFCHSHQ